MATTTKHFDKENVNITFIKSNKGQPLLVLNNYVYKCNKKTGKKKYWTCINVGCQLNIHTDINDVYISGGIDQHSHEPNPDMVTVRQVRDQIKERAVNEVIPISLIYEQEIS